jgi:hypothetical protein
LDDGDIESEDKQTMTFDEIGNFISVKDLRTSASSSSNTNATTTSKQQQQQQQSSDENNNANKTALSTSSSSSVTSNQKAKSEDKKVNSKAKQTSSSSSSGSASGNSSNDDVSTKPKATNAPAIASQGKTNEAQQTLANNIKTNSSGLNQQANGGQGQDQNVDLDQNNVQMKSPKTMMMTKTKMANDDPNIGAVPIDHPDADNWFYLDPQDQVQGPFSADQMASWFVAGYFSLNLTIKRGRDDKFVPLGLSI